MSDYSLEEIVKIKKCKFEGKECYKLDVLDGIYYIDIETFLPIFYQSNSDINRKIRKI